jgi:proteasome lid subunit RPN8/RPN11
MTSASTSSSEATIPPPPETTTSSPASDWLANCLLHGERPQPNQVGILISQEALRQIDRHCNTDLHRELGGVLLGKAFQRQGQQWVAIAAALPAISDQHGPVHFTFTADVWAKINRDRESLHPQLTIVGWFHTHPDLGVFYSADDVVVHTVAFRELWHIGLVVDPVRQEACFFGWDQQNLLDGLERAIFPIEGYYERTDEQPTQVVNWFIGRDRAWDRPMSRRATRPRPNLSDVALDDDLTPSEGNFYAPGNEWPTLAPTTGLWLGLAGLTLIVILLLAVILPLEQRATTLQSVLLTFADQTMAEANANGAAACPDPQLRLIVPSAGTTVARSREVAVIGTADVAAAHQYIIYIQAATAENEDWSTVTQFRRDRSLAQLGILDASTLAPGLYQLDLVALSREGQTIGESCTIVFELK